MKKLTLPSLFLTLLTLSLAPLYNVHAQNQTPDVSPIYPGSELPFTVSVELADFSLPNGIHSCAAAEYHGLWIFLAGRTNGLHGFDNSPVNNNFPPQQQNTTVFVVDPAAKTVFTKDWSDPSSGLTQSQIDLLSVTSPQFYQHKDTLYITGGYGIDTESGQFGTKPYLTAINMPGLIHWVTSPSQGETAAQYIRQISDPIFQVTGGYMALGHDDITLLIFGQNFTGYYTDSSNGQYSEQVRRFKIIDNGKYLGFEPKRPNPFAPDPNFRRRDLNVVPIVDHLYSNSVPAFIAYSGVFTEAGGAWTVPVLISNDGHAHMDNPSDQNTFKQGMNNYVCATLGLYSKKHKDMYVIFFGGISYEFYQNGTFQSDAELPFINQFTTIKFDKRANFTQYLMDSEYPVILSTGTNPGNPLLFGAGAQFMPATNVPYYENDVFKLDRLGNQPQLVGYIVGGIQSTLPNTNTKADSAASPYIFTVTISRQN